MRSPSPSQGGGFVQSSPPASLMHSRIASLFGTLKNFKNKGQCVNIVPKLKQKYSKKVPETIPESILPQKCPHWVSPLIYDIFSRSATCRNHHFFMYFVPKTMQKSMTNLDTLKISEMLLPGPRSVRNGVTFSAHLPQVGTVTLTSWSPWGSRWASDLPRMPKFSKMCQSEPKFNLIAPKWSQSYGKCANFH